MTYKQIVLNYSKKISTITHSPQKEIINFLAFITNTSNIQILKNYNKLITNKYVIKKLKNFIKKRVKNYPYEYITKEVFFYEYLFFIKKGVLIPRSESEILLEKSMQIVKIHKLNNILDMCCGSGILGICLQKQINGLNIVSSDISKKAIKLSKKNAKFLEVENKIKFIKSDLLSNIDKKLKFDLCISNPPYIKDDYILSKNVTYEPSLALFGGDNGCDIIFRLIKQCKDRGIGFLACEMGYDQKQLVIDFVKNIEYKNINFYKDYAGFDRGFVLEF